MDKQIDHARIEARMLALERACEFVKPIVEEHSLERYSTGNALSTAAVYTPVDQHLAHILMVADWLLEE